MRQVLSSNPLLGDLQSVTPKDRKINNIVAIELD